MILHHFTAKEKALCSGGVHVFQGFHVHFKAYNKWSITFAVIIHGKYQTHYLK